MTPEEVKAGYAKTPWGKLLIEMGWEPYDTESSARRVAEFAVQQMADDKKRIRKLEIYLERIIAVMLFKTYTDPTELLDKIKAVVEDYRNTMIINKTG